MTESTPPATPAGPPTHDPHAPLRHDAARLYRERAKPALKRGLVDVRPDAQLDDSDYVVDVVGVESKCTEFIQGSRHGDVSASYLALKAAGDARASSRWFAALDKTADFPLLDSYQLVKHYLGLMNTFETAALTLVYLYWEP